MLTPVNHPGKGSVETQEEYGAEKYGKRGKNQVSRDDTRFHFLTIPPSNRMTDPTFRPLAIIKTSLREEDSEGVEKMRGRKQKRSKLPHYTDTREAYAKTGLMNKVWECVCM